MKKIILLLSIILIIGAGCSNTQQDKIIEQQQKQIEELTKKVEFLQTSSTSDEPLGLFPKKSPVVEKHTNQTGPQIMIEICKNKYLVNHEYDTMEEFDTLWAEVQEAYRSSQSIGSTTSFEELKNQLEKIFFNNKYQECLNKI